MKTTLSQRLVFAGVASTSNAALRHVFCSWKLNNNTVVVCSAVEWLTQPIEFIVLSSFVRLEVV